MNLGNQNPQSQCLPQLPHPLPDFARNLTRRRILGFMRISFHAVVVAAALTIFLPGLRAQTAASADPKSISVVDAGLGPCTADFVVNDSAGSPVYAAKVRVHIAYGFMSAHKLDLEVGANAAGKARFVGLPEQTRHGLFFQASEGDREASAFDDPAKTCKANFTLALRKTSGDNR